MPEGLCFRVNLQHSLVVTSGPFCRGHIGTREAHGLHCHLAWPQDFASCPPLSKLHWDGSEDVTVTVSSVITPGAPPHKAAADDGVCADILIWGGGCLGKLLADVASQRRFWPGQNTERCGKQKDPLPWFLK